jgi:hypothetical protein
LDYVAWGISSEQYRLKHPTKIEFPIYAKKPLSQNESVGYAGKVKGMSDSARRAIERLQPYNRPDPFKDSLWIVHRMDIIDKHKALVMAYPIVDLRVPPHLAGATQFYLNHESLPMHPEVAREIKQNVQLLPQITFREFGVQPVILALSQLETDIRIIVASFDDELRNRQP